jgi:hypothetical protein
MLFLACAGAISAIATVFVSCGHHAPLYRVAQPAPASAPGRAAAGAGYAEVPQIDLHTLLSQSAQGAGGGGISPFQQRLVLADASCLPSLDEEVWVIERPGAKQARVAGDDVPGCGALMTSLSAEPSTEVPVPLKHTDVRASIAGAIASVEVTQQFVNPFAEKIEAVYVFPLPDNAAVNEFLMTVGDRRIRGIIREREEAQKIYQEARSQGYVASLLTEERPNIFTQKVANIEPGRQIDISIRYFNTLAYADGAFEFVFPMVVGPRFNPPHRTDGVYARPEGMPRQGLWGDKANVF